MKNYYCLMHSGGGIKPSVKEKILSGLDNDMAKKHLDRAIEVGREELEKHQIYAMEYGNVCLYFVSAWTSARYARLNVAFENSENVNE